MEDISPAEFFLLNCIYEMGEGDFQKILQRVNNKKTDAKDWKKSTVLTLLKRLIDKGYIVRVKQGRFYVYRPKLSWMDTIELALERFFGSSYKSLLFSYFLKSSELSKKDIDLLNQYLKASDKETGDE